MKQVKVFDTWVEGKNDTLHFDVCVSADSKDAENIALKLAEEYLKSRGESGKVTSSECQFCHVEPVAEPSLVKQIEEKGGFIIPFN